MRVLVVGGAGAVGRTVTSGLLAKGHAVRVLDVVEATFSNKLDNQQPGSLLDGIVGSVADQEVVLAAAEGMDAVIHLSYAPRPPEEKAQWESNLQVNLNGTYNVFEACKAAGVKRVALASRAGVHSGWGSSDSWVQRTVEERTRPVGHYTVSKVFMEAIGYSYAAQNEGMAVSDSNWPLYDLEHGRKVIGYFPQQRSVVTEDFEAGQLAAEPPPPSGLAKL